MHYTIHQLQVLLKVAETGSITKAAEALHITQPAASMQLKKLQSQFDSPLLEVLGKQVHLTELGIAITEMAQQIEDKMIEINYRTQAYKGGLSGRLKLATVSTGKYVLPYFLTDFLKLHPNIELSMDVTNKAGVIHDIEQNKADIALVSVLPQRTDVSYLNILPNHLFLVGNTLHAEKLGSIGKEALSSLPLIYREKGSATRLAMEQFIERKKITVRKKLELTSNEAVKQAVIAGLGYSIMPLIGIRNELLNGQLQLLAVKGLPLKTEWRFIWLKQKKLSPVASAFLAYTQAHTEYILKSQFSWTKQWLG